MIFFNGYRSRFLENHRCFSFAVSLFHNIRIPYPVCITAHFALLTNFFLFLQFCHALNWYGPVRFSDGHPCYWRNKNNTNIRFTISTFDYHVPFHLDVNAQDVLRTIFPSISVLYVSEQVYSMRTV